MRDYILAIAQVIAIGAMLRGVIQFIADILNRKE
jgi:hypothetical protein